MTQTLMNEGWAGLHPQQKSSVAGLPLKHCHSKTSRGMLRGLVTWQPATGKAREAWSRGLCWLRLSICSCRMESRRSHTQQIPCI